MKHPGAGKPCPICAEMDILPGILENARFCLKDNRCVFLEISERSKDVGRFVLFGNDGSGHRC